jgi:hypothetical protein
MLPSGRQLDRQAFLLVRRAIAKTTQNRKWWSQKWDRAKLADEGYSELVIRKARHYDQKDGWWGSFFVLFILWLGNNSEGNWKYLWYALVALNLATLFFGKWSYAKERLSDAENERVIAELTARLGEHDQPAEIPVEHPLLESWNRRLEERPILWRLDNYLSRRIVFSEPPES